MLSKVITKGSALAQTSFTVLLGWGQTFTLLTQLCQAKIIEFPDGQHNQAAGG